MGFYSHSGTMKRGLGIGCAVVLVLFILPGSCEENSTRVVTSQATEEAISSLCGSTNNCRLELGEVCAQNRCVCPERKDRRNEEEKCTGYQDIVLPLMLSPGQFDGLMYNDSNGRNDSAHDDAFANKVQDALYDILEKSKFSKQYIRIFIDKIHPADSPKTNPAKGGLLVEFTLRLVSSITLNETEVYNELIRIIDSSPNKAIGNSGLLADPVQPPFQCFRKDCPQDQECVPNGESYTCKGQPERQDQKAEDQCKCLSPFVCRGNKCVCEDESVVQSGRNCSIQASTETPSTASLKPEPTEPQERQEAQSTEILETTSTAPDAAISAATIGPVASTSCSSHGRTVTSNDNITRCLCDHGYSGTDCAVKEGGVREASVWTIGGVQVEWSWISFGIGSGLGVLLCVTILLFYLLIKRRCRKKPAIRPSIDDEVFNFHEVTRNVYGTGAARNGKHSGSIRSVERTPPIHYASNSVECPYAVSDVSVSTFKRNGQLT